MSKYEETARTLGAADGRELLALGIYDEVLTAKQVLCEHARIHSLLSGMGYEGSTEKMVNHLIADAVGRKAERDNLTKELAEAETRLDLLDALEAAGVDNWAGYSEAMKALGNDDGQQRAKKEAARRESAQLRARQAVTTERLATMMQSGYSPGEAEEVLFMLEVKAGHRNAPPFEQLLLAACQVRERRDVAHADPPKPPPAYQRPAPRRFISSPLLVSVLALSMLGCSLPAQEENE